MAIFKRLLDVTGAALGLVAASPVLLPAMILTWLYDRHSPLYIAPRLGRSGGMFAMVKLRSMVAGADRTGVDSTSARDARITPIGRFVRRFKIDELPQLWNVLTGEMSLVGPRPQVPREAALYTPLERRLLDVRPGVTDFASIVFSDLADILEDQGDADLAYNQLVRPWKSRLGLFYVDHGDCLVDIQIVGLTAMAVFSRRLALSGVQSLLRRLGASDELVQVAGRRDRLVPQPPPGSDRIVTSRAAGRAM